MKENKAPMTKHINSKHKTVRQTEIMSFSKTKTIVDYAIGVLKKIINAKKKQKKVKKDKKSYKR